MDQSLATLLALFTSHREFAAVHMARVMAADHDLDVSEAFTDRLGRPIVDAAPEIDIYSDVEPVTLRCPVARPFCVNCIAIEAA
jgi:hypothetical protein